MGKLFKKLTGATGRASGKGNVNSLTDYSGTILDKNMTALTGKQRRRRRNDSGVQELLGGA